MISLLKFNKLFNESLIFPTKLKLNFKLSLFFKKIDLKDLILILFIILHTNYVVQSTNAPIFMESHHLTTFIYKQKISVLLVA